MFYRLFFFYLYLLTFYIIANAESFIYTNYTIENIENFKLEPDNGKCPEYSSSEIPIKLDGKEYETITACEYQYFCHKNSNCILVKSTSSINNFSDKFNDYGNYLNNENKCENKKDENSLCDIDKLILISCNKTQFEKKLCSTDICVSNQDCFSNNCVDGVCVVNDENPAYICRTRVENSDLKVKCLLAYEEKCAEDNECGDYTRCGKEKICLKESTKSDSLTMYLISALLTIILILFGVGIYLIIKYHHKITEQ